MTRIFSYIYYTLSKPYRAGWDRLHPHIGAHALLTLLQSFNVLTISAPYLDKPLNEYLWLGFATGLYAINLFFFNAKSLTKFDKRWDNEPKYKRFFKRSLVILYVFASLFSFFYVGWYF